MEIKIYPLTIINLVTFHLSSSFILRSLKTSKEFLKLEQNVSIKIQNSGIHSRHFH